ncbi:hypothetical protein CSOJ01_14911 [Colletotrichum sojae]|uniref:JmjC domain-containing protein n=1 Tax=Colletotrichum sojae TaxID=2175907 RepID=A0A8H6IPS0_9PEZI|nr:hypothetical protein CSOJ01_14911 [Colletotrichum sojae]
MKRPEQRDQLGNEYFPGTPERGFSFLKLSTSSRFNFPRFPSTTIRPSDDQLEAFLDEAVESPPQGNIPYYVGPPLSPDFDSLLHPGEQLAQFTAIDGVNSYYWHAGERFSGTSVHSEDCRFWSANLVFVGLKLWIVISEYHTAKFEEFIRQHWKTNHCAQSVRHLSLFISPRRLREEGIDFVIHCAGPATWSSQNQASTTPSSTILRVSQSPSTSCSPGRQLSHQTYMSASNAGCAISNIQVFVRFPARHPSTKHRTRRQRALALRTGQNERGIRHLWNRL